MNQVSRSRALMAFVLFLACVGSLGLLAMRTLFVGHLQLRFLIWNLFLAAMVFLPALIVDIGSRRRWPGAMLLPLGLAWLVMFPNAPYLTTDLVHLGANRHVALWFDGLLYFSFAATGLLIGFSSLYLIQTVVELRCGSAWGWLVAATAIALGGYGIFLGRIQRWNSWDVLTHPGRLLHNARIQVTDPLSNKNAFVLSLGFAVFMAAVYGALRAFSYMVAVDR